MSPKKLRRLPRQSVWVDDKGRITMPKYLRESAGIDKGSWVLVEAYPDMDNCTSLLIMRDY